LRADSFAVFLLHLGLHHGLLLLLLLSPQADLGIRVMGFSNLVAGLKNP
jgi:hypothetical protein